MTRLAAVGAEACVEAAAAFLLSKRRADTPSGIDVHSVGCWGWLLVLQAGLGGLGDRLGDKRRARWILEPMTTAGGVGSGLVGLDRYGCGNKRLKGNGEGTTADKFISDNLYQLLHEFKDSRCIRPSRIKCIGDVSGKDSKL